jgi:signal transduction histidine kinase
MNDLIDRLFLFSKLDLGKIQFHFQRIALYAFLSDTCEELQFDYPSMEIHLDEPEQEIHVHADPTHLHRVISNLIDNAQKYSENEKAAVNITVESNGPMAEVTIRDNGPGIADDDLPRIFERFRRGDASRSSRQEGSGLGLAIARQIIIAHGGSIAGRNSRNGGLEITLTLRLANEEDTHN